MTQEITRIAQLADRYDAIVFDQWGVLHDGSSPYSGAVAALTELTQSACRLAVLSNSGKRSAPNAARISAMGFQAVDFDEVMTSGEALWRDIAEGRVGEQFFYAIERDLGDAASWAAGLDITFSDLGTAQAVLLMGLPDGSKLADWTPVLETALSRGLPVYCSNPDRKSPRADGLVISPGALGFAYKDMGGDVSFYGKPHKPVFTALENALGTKRLLMVGDSLEHDISGAKAAGWDSLFVAGGLYAAHFEGAEKSAAMAKLLEDTGMPAPTYMIGELR